MSSLPPKRDVDLDHPGIYRQDVFLQPMAGMPTGVPVFLGYAKREPEMVPINSARTLTLWPQFVDNFGLPLAPRESNEYLPFAVHGFFINGGQICHVVRLNDRVSADQALREGLDAVEEQVDNVDLVCAPDIMRKAETSLSTTDDWTPYRERMRARGEDSPDPERAVSMQGDVLERCHELGDRFAILDSLPGASVEDVVIQRKHLSAREPLSGADGALYYPWVRIIDGPKWTRGFVPPCGHVAGLYARSDLGVGVHKAPANDVLEGVLDLEINLANSQQDLLNPVGVNCLRAFPGRGIRVWGARTLSLPPADRLPPYRQRPEDPWTYVNVRRLFLTAARWVERNTLDLPFEPSDARLWSRIERELTAYFTDLYQRGALIGRTPEEAFYIKCDAETNPQEVRDQGYVVTEIGLAPTLPNEFVKVRIIHSASGMVISGPTSPAGP